MKIEVRHTKGLGLEKFSIYPGLRVRKFRDVSTGFTFYRHEPLIGWTPF